MAQPIALIEVATFTGTLVVLDVVEKAADVTLIEVEQNDLLGGLIKITGTTAALRAAASAAEEAGRRFNAPVVTDVISAPDAEAMRAIRSPQEYSGLLEQNIVYFPQTAGRAKENPVSENGSFAIGLIETQGLIAVLEAVDTACKAANVTVLGREKIGGGYVTVMLKGDVAAVKAAIEAGKAKVDGLGKFIAAHVIARPSEGLLSLLPKA